MLSDRLACLLASSGFSTDQQYNGQEGMFASLDQKFDLVLMNTSLPGFSSFSVLERLRNVRQTPVMMLSSDASEKERMNAYSKGADDYISIPCNFSELVLRLKSLLRRSRWRNEAGIQHHCLELDELQLVRLGQEVSYMGIKIPVTPIQFRLLWVLAENKNEVLSKQFLYQAVLQRAFSRYDRSLDMHLSRVRKKLIDAGMLADRLATVHGKGFRLA